MKAVEREAKRAYREIESVKRLAMLTTKRRLKWHVDDGPKIIASHYYKLLADSVERSGGLELHKIPLIVTKHLGRKHVLEVAEYGDPVHLITVDCTQCGVVIATLYDVPSKRGRKK